MFVKDGKVDGKKVTFAVLRGVPLASIAGAIARELTLEKLEEVIDKVHNLKPGEVAYFRDNRYPDLEYLYNVLKKAFGNQIKMEIHLHWWGGVLVVEKSDLGVRNEQDVV